MAGRRFSVRGWCTKCANVDSDPKCDHNLERHYVPSTPTPQRKDRLFHRTTARCPFVTTAGGKPASAMITPFAIIESSVCGLRESPARAHERPIVLAPHQAADDCSLHVYQENSGKFCGRRRVFLVGFPSMIRRHQHVDVLLKRLSTFPVVAILGPRQILLKHAPPRTPPDSASPG